MPRVLSLRLRSALAGVALAGTLAPGGRGGAEAVSPKPAPSGSVRIATFNASLNRDAYGALIEEAASGDSAQMKAAAEIIQRVRPDILLINEIDRDRVGRAVHFFKAYYLAAGWNGAAAIDYPHVYFAPVNTGAPSGHDLDRNGAVVSTPGEDGYAGDAFGYGAFSGQYAMAVLSKYPIDGLRVRTFQKFLWKDMPGALLPDHPEDGAGGWYHPAALEVFRLSSKSHWDLPVTIGGKALHILASHPTPPVFDGPEGRNRRRNHDEIRLWADYIAPDRADYLYDDAGRRGGLAEKSRFVILGDLNADPNDGASHPGAIGQLLGHPRINADFIPSSLGAEIAAKDQGGVNTRHTGPAGADTADFSDDRENDAGNLRADYVLPSRAGLRVLDAGVFWPAPGAAHADLAGKSDHRLVWMDVEVVETE